MTLAIKSFQIDGIKLVTPRVFSDDRGYFFESFNQRQYNDLGIEGDWVQDNQSFSTKGTLRGLHYQVDQPQAKLVRVVEGRVLDVAVDIRPGSPTYGKWQSVELDAQQHQLFYVPAGFAHGFQVLSERAVFLYKCSNFYAPNCERGILWNDPALAIDWPLKNPQLSPKDLALPLLAQLDPDEVRC